MSPVAKAAWVWPPDTSVYCRGCQHLTPHNEDPFTRDRIRCADCGHSMLTVEVLCTYATSIEKHRLEILPPREFLSLEVRAVLDAEARKKAGSMYREPSFRQADPYEDLDEELEELWN